MSISDRELYKKLKKHKVFSKFCICCTKAFCEDLSYGGNEYTLRDYLKSTAKPLMERDELDFVGQIKKWGMTPPYLKILYGKKRKNCGI
jgi:hypothetical protein